MQSAQYESFRLAPSRRLTCTDIPFVKVEIEIEIKIKFEIEIEIARQHRPRLIVKSKEHSPLTPARIAANRRAKAY